MERVSDKELKKMIKIFGTNKVRWAWLDEKLSLTQNQIKNILGLDNGLPTSKKVYFTGEQFQRVCEIYEENLRLKTPIKLDVSGISLIEENIKALGGLGKTLDRKNKRGK